MKGFAPRAEVLGIDTSVPASERYEVIGQIALGGMAEIYLGRMSSRRGHPREIILKRLLPDLQADDEFVQMFYDEARIAAQLHHPNIGEIYELGQLETSPFIAMELIHGVNVRQLQEELTRRGERLAPGFAAQIVAGVLDALAFAHGFKDRAGRDLHIVHRDVSPQNVMVSYSGSIKLLDFGVAKAEGKVHQTRAGLLKGKIEYMAPEQVLGSAVDQRTDIYAAGVMLYELLHDRHPFLVGDSPLGLMKFFRDPNMKPPEHDPALPAKVVQVIERALSKDPARRYPDALSMKREIEDAAMELPLPPRTSLADLVRSVFSSRIEAEERARRDRDDILLIHALRSHVDDSGLSLQEGDLRLSPPVKSDGRLDSATEAELDVTGVAYFQEETRVRSGAGLELPTTTDLQIQIDVVEGEETEEEVEENEAMTQIVSAEEIGRGEAMPMQLGRFDILREIGEEESGELYHGVAEGAFGFKKPHAVQRLSPQATGVRSYLEAISNLSRLSHPNVVGVWDVTAHEGAPVIAFEWVPGWSVRTILRACAESKTLPPIPVICLVVRDAAQGLHAAHELQTTTGPRKAAVHADLTPSSILVDRHGISRVSGFAARLLRRGRAPLNRRLAYRAPELLEDRQPTPASDVFSLGAILWEMTTLEPLFLRDSADETKQAILRGVVPRLEISRARVPEKLQTILDRALDPKVEGRYPDAEAFAHDLFNLLNAFDPPPLPAHVAGWTKELMDDDV